MFDIVADVSAGALGRDRRCGFLHDRSLDVAGLGHVYTVFVIELASRQVQILGSTLHPDDVFMRQVARTLTQADGKVYRVLICDRDAKWSAPVRARLEEGGLCVIQTQHRAPNCNAHAERFVRSMKEECLDRVIR